MLSKIKRILSVKDIEVFLELIKNRIDWEPVGGNRDNFSTINLSSQPISGITERITNAIDAVIEKRWVELNKPDNARNPRIAIEEWFEKKEIFDKVEVSIYDSDNVNTPTIQVLDKGIGVKGEDFGQTILSLHAGNKLDKLFLSGAYGQGGSTSLGYQTYTIFISKPYFDNPNNEVFFTVVRYNDGDNNKDKNGWYEYCVDKRNKKNTLSFIDDSIHHGTRVVNINCDVSGNKGTVRSRTGSLYRVLNETLFDPVLPIKLFDNRKEAKKDNIKSSINGNRSRLSNFVKRKDKPGYYNFHQLSYLKGTINLHYWVLDFKSDRAHEHLKDYVSKNYPIIVTYNGQKHGHISKTTIKNDVQLPYLDGYLIVQVELDEITNESKRKLLSTSRESLRDTESLREIKELIVSVLQSDETLYRLNNEIKKSFLTNNDKTDEELIQKNIENNINGIMRTSLFGVEKEKRKPIEPKPPKELEYCLKDVPTFIDITRSNNEVEIGRHFSIKFKIDTYKSNIFKHADIIESPKVRYDSTEISAKDGVGTALFSVPNNKFLIGEDITVGVNYITDQVELEDTIELKIIDFVEKKPKEKNVVAPNIKVVSVNSSHAYYVRNQWNEFTVGDVQAEKDEWIIYINIENYNLARLINRARKYDVEDIAKFKSFYKEYVGLYLAIMEYNSKESELKKVPEELTIDENYIKAEKLRISQIVTRMAENLFDVIKNN
jgi:hypothetical protein